MSSSHRPFADDEPAAPPTAPDGSDFGSLPDRAAEPETGPKATPGPQDSRPINLSAALQAHLTGEPGSLPPTWCKVCEVEVKPQGKGVCPRCKTFLKLNFMSRRHPVNKLRKQQLLEKLVADYLPQTTLAHSSCEMLAGILEQLEVLKPGSPDHQRLVQMSQLLGTSLEEKRTSAAPPREPTNYDALSNAELAALLAAHAEEAARAAAAEAEGRRLIEEAARNSEQPPQTSSVAVDVELPATPAPPPTCAYCGGPAASCEQIRQGDNWWMGVHAQRQDVIGLLERQRQMRIKWGHETPWGGGILRMDDVIRAGGTTPDDNPTAVMLHRIEKWKR